MLFQFNFYSSLLLIFVVHGLVYAAMCWRKSRQAEHPSYAWLALYLVLSVLFVVPWMVGFAGWYDNQPYRDILLYTPTKFTWALGPVMFIYVQSLLNPSYRFRGKQWWHLAPLGIYLLLHGYIYLHDKVWQVQPLILAEGADPDFSDEATIPGLLSMIVYFLMALRYYRLYRRLMLQVISYADQLLFKWVRNFLLAFLLFVVITIAFGIIGRIWDVYYEGSWWYYLSFALIFYYIAITGYSNAVETTVAFRPLLLQNKAALLLPYQQAPSGSGSGGPAAGEAPVVEDIDYIDVDHPTAGLDAQFPLAQWQQRVLQLMNEQQAWEDPELSLVSMAGQLRTNPSLLSKVINQGFGKNFNDFVNQYRVAALQQKLQQGEHRRQTLLSLAYECGFNSKATFNRAFQKQAGMGPREWLKQQGLG